MTALDFTGERFMPGVAGEIWYEHWHRYHYALPLAAGRDVLDVACGAGYGSALLAGRARSVCGVDRSLQAVAHAAAAYRDVARAHFVAGDCGALPFAPASFDMVVTFETVEHITAQEQFLDEVVRVLRPDGLLVLSSPNRPVYSPGGASTNPFHARELDHDELALLLAPRFPHVAWYGHHASFFSVIAPLGVDGGSPQDGAGELSEIHEASAALARPGPSRPRYYLVLASRSAETLGDLPRRLSVLADGDEWVQRDYAKVTRELHAAHARGNALERAMLEWQGHHAEAVRQRDLLRSAHDEAVRQRDAALATASTGQASAAWCRKLEADIATLKSEIAARDGWRGWCRTFLRLVRGGQGGRIRRT